MRWGVWVFVFLAVILLMSLVSAQLEVLSCTELNSSGSYLLNTSITDWGGAGACINITVSDVELDCQGWENYLDGINSDYTYGIKSEGVYLGELTNVTVKNCNLTNWRDGIYFIHSGNSSIINITTSNNVNNGVDFISGSTNFLTNVTVLNNLGTGVILISVANTTFTNLITGNNSNHGLYVVSSSNNTFRNITASNNSESGLAFFSLSFNNTLININSSFNHAAGIYLSQSSNYSIVNSTLAENDYFDFDILTESNADCENNLTDVTGSGNRLIKYYNNMVNLNDEVFSELILCNADYSNLTNITIDGSLNKENNLLFIIQTEHSTFTKINSSHNYRGVSLSNCNSNNTLTNITALNNSAEGIIFAFSNYNQILGSTIKGNKQDGFSILYSSFNNITGCMIENNSVPGFGGIDIISSPSVETYNSSYNRFWNNVINNTPNGGLNLNTYGPNYTNYFNTTKTAGTNIIGGQWIGGNYWSNYIGNDTTGDYIGEIAYSINETYMRDSLPLTLDTLWVDYNISGCRNITKAGRYILNKSITDWAGVGACINIPVSDVEIDCQNHLIDGQDIITGIRAEGTSSNKLSNITIRNCNLTDWNYGAYYTYTQNSTLDNITSSSNSDGIYLSGSSFNTFVNLTVSNNNQSGIYLLTSNNNLLFDINASGNSAGSCCNNGIWLENSSNNNLTNINALRNSDHGIYIKYSTNNNLLNINASYNSDGLRFLGSSNNIITKLDSYNNSRYGIWLDGSNNNLLININIQNSGDEGINYYLSYNNTILDSIQRGSTNYDLNITDMPIDLVDNIMGKYRLNNATLSFTNTSSGVINLPNITQNGTNLSNDLVVRYNYVFVNLNNAPGFNRSSNITFYGLGFGNPLILRDGVLCPSSICALVSYNSGTLVFSVTGFSNYSATEGPPIIPPSGGAGGGATGATYDLGNLVEPMKATARISDKLKFALNSTNYTLSFNSITKDLISIMVRASKTTTKVVYINRTEDIDLDSDSVNDLSVSYDNYTRISNTAYAYLTIKPLVVISPPLPQQAVCGNSIIEAGENCESCSADFKCKQDEECKNAACVKKSSAPTAPTTPITKISLKTALFIVSLILGLFVLFTIVFVIVKKGQKTAEKEKNVQELMKLTVSAIQLKNFELVKEYYLQLKQVYNELPQADKESVYDRLAQLEKKIEELEKAGYFS